MRAVPVATTGAVTTPSTPMPCSSSARRIAAPASSSPTQPISRTSAPRRRAATAWFAPFPPRLTRSVPEETVSPTRGSRGRATV